MKCISDELIQKHIDNEASQEERAYVDEHLLSCVACRNAVNEQKKLAVEIRNTINLLCEETVEIPAFNRPVKDSIDKSRVKTGRKKHRVIFLWSTGVASVACILTFLFLNPRKKNVDNYERLFYNTEFEFDANRSVTQQDIVIKILDSEGNFSEYNI